MCYIYTNHTPDISNTVEICSSSTVYLDNYLRLVISGLAIVHLLSASE